MTVLPRIAAFPDVKFLVSDMNDSSSRERTLAKNRATTGLRTRTKPLSRYWRVLLVLRTD
jgi:hypothetical protein